MPFFYPHDSLSFISIIFSLPESNLCRFFLHLLLLPLSFRDYIFIKLISERSSFQITFHRFLRKTAIVPACIHSVEFTSAKAYRQKYAFPTFFVSEGIPGQKLYNIGIVLLFDICDIKTGCFNPPHLIPALNGSYPVHRSHSCFPFQLGINSTCHLKL